MEILSYFSFLLLRIIFYLIIYGLVLISINLRPLIGIDFERAAAKKL